MARLSRIDAVFVVATAGVWLGLMLWTSEAAINRFFLAVLATCLLYLVRLGAVSWQGAAHEQRRAAGVRRLRPEEVARAAVAEERARLSSDIARCLREAMVDVRDDAQEAQAAADPVPALLRVQAHTRRATSELRRQLGLLRGSDAVDVDAIPPTVRDDPPRVSRRDLMWGTGAGLLALLEVPAYLLTEGYGDRPDFSPAWFGTVLLSALAAGSLTLRRPAPVVAALWCAAAFGVGTLLGAPVGGGFWAIATIGGLCWTLAATAPARLGTALAWVGLTGAVLHSRLVDDPDNAFIFGLIIAVATALGLAVRLARLRGDRASASARSHEQALQDSARVAVAQERQEFAREIHDVVSHAVGLIAMQAGAAEMSWPHVPDVTRRAIRVIADTAGSTLAEIDRLLPGAVLGEVGRIEDLVGRIRATGTSVGLVREGEPDPALASLTYRIVQEGLTNAVRHAPGAVVRVELRSAREWLEVVVADDGPGPDDRHQPGYGLVGLGERVSQAGGSLTVGLGPGGRGFRLQARVPVHIEQVAP